MSNLNEQDQHVNRQPDGLEKQVGENRQAPTQTEDKREPHVSQSAAPSTPAATTAPDVENPKPAEVASNAETRPIERKAPGRPGARGTAAMDPQTRQEVARKGGLAVSRNKQHMAEIGRKGGQSVSKNREHMAQIGRKGGAASRGHR